MGDEARVYKAFQTFDENGDGKISVAEMSKVLGKDESEVKALIAEVDTDKNGEVDYDEFIAMWAKDSGGYMWDDDQEDVQRDIDKSRKEVEARRTSLVGSQPVESVGTSNETGEEVEGGGGGGASVLEEKSDLPSAEELLASLKGQAAPAESNEWTSIALGGDSDDEGGDDEPEEKAKPAKKGKEKSGKKKEKPAKKSDGDDDGGWADLLGL